MFLSTNYTHSDVIYKVINMTKADAGSFVVTVHKPGKLNHVKPILHSTS